MKSPTPRGAALVAALACLVPVTLPASAQATDRPAAATATPTASGTADAYVPPAGITGSVDVTALRSKSAQSLPVPGVRFTLRRVAGLDLTQAADWAKATEYVNAFGVPDGTTYEWSAELPATDAQGKTSIGDLPLGLYHLTAPEWSEVYFTVPMKGENQTVTWMTGLKIFPKHMPAASDLATPSPSPSTTPARGPFSTPTVSAPAPSHTATDQPTPTPSDTPTGALPVPSAPATTPRPVPTGGGNDHTGSFGGGSSGSSGGGSAGGQVVEAVRRRLAYTGMELNGPVGVAAVALLLGTGLVLIGHRRREGNDA